MHFTSASSRKDTRFTTLTLLLASAANVGLVDDGERIEVGEELVLEEDGVAVAVVRLIERVRRGRRGERQADSREEEEEEEGLRGIIRERRGRDGTVVVVVGLSIFFLPGKGDFGQYVVHCCLETVQDVTSREKQAAGPASTR